jgi:hypothetical protein
MKALGAFLALGLAACLGNEPVTEDEVIQSFGPIGDADQWIADGTSPILIEIRTADQASLDPKLAATLVASAGAWQLADADVKTATVTMSSQREQRLWTPPTQSGTVSLKATIGMVTRATSLTLRNAPIQRVRLGREGVLSATDASMLTITAHLDVANNGLPSTNTPVSFAVQVNEPPGGAAYFGTRELRSGPGSAVPATLFVSKGVTRLTVTATAAPDGRPPVTSDPLVITP